jgi:hypothetical protein
MYEISEEGHYLRVSTRVNGSKLQLQINVPKYTGTIISPLGTYFFTYKHKYPGPMKNFLLICWVSEILYRGYYESLLADQKEFIETLYTFSNTVQYPKVPLI